MKPANTSPNWTPGVGFDWSTGRYFGVSTRHESQNAVDGYEWHGHHAWIAIPDNADEDAIDEYFVNGPGAALIADAHSGYTSEWDGHNFAARFDEDAEFAIAEIEAWLAEPPLISGEVVAEVYDWFAPVKNELGILATTTDEELEALAASEEEQGVLGGFYFSGTLAVFEHFREELRADAADA